MATCTLALQGPVCLERRQVENPTSELKVSLPLASNVCGDGKRPLISFEDDAAVVGLDVIRKGVPAGERLATIHAGIQVGASSCRHSRRWVCHPCNCGLRDGHSADAVHFAEQI